jgi:hypothetical protein
LLSSLPSNFIPGHSPPKIILKIMQYLIPWSSTPPSPFYAKLFNITIKKTHKTKSKVNSHFKNNPDFIKTHIICEFWAFLTKI